MTIMIIHTVFIHLYYQVFDLLFWASLRPIYFFHVLLLLAMNVMFKHAIFASCLLNT